MQVLALVLGGGAIFLAGMIAGLRYRRHELERQMGYLAHARMEMEALSEDYRKRIREGKVAVTITNGRSSVEQRDG